jgi:DNA-binding GntR family transcriptional regulator
MVDHQTIPTTMRGAMPPVKRAPAAAQDSAIRFVDPGLIRDQIAAALREAIVAGRLSPGERLTERDLVAKLGISRSPLREAIRTLEAEGLVTTAPHRGAWVSELQAEDFQETVGVRLMLETCAARAAGERKNGTLLRALEAAVDATRGAARRADPLAEVERSMRFHDTFVEACGNRKLIQFYEVIKRHLRRYQLLAFAKLARAERATNEHAQILAAFRDGDAAEVERRLTAHIQRASNEILSHLTGGD